MGGGQQSNGLVRRSDNPPDSQNHFRITTAHNGCSGCVSPQNPPTGRAKHQDNLTGFVWFLQLLKGTETFAGGQRSFEDLSPVVVREQNDAGCVQRFPVCVCVDMDASFFLLHGSQKLLWSLFLLLFFSLSQIVAELIEKRQRDV